MGGSRAQRLGGEIRGVVGGEADEEAAGETGEELSEVAFRVEAVAAGRSAVQ